VAHWHTVAHGGTRWHTVALWGTVGHCGTVASGSADALHCGTALALTAKVQPLPRSHAHARSHTLPHSHTAATQPHCSTDTVSLWHWWRMAVPPRAAVPQSQATHTTPKSNNPDVTATCHCAAATVTAAVAVRQCGCVAVAVRGSGIAWQGQRKTQSQN
jgi:hypothetical protein